MDVTAFLFSFFYLILHPGNNIYRKSMLTKKILITLSAIFICLIPNRLHAQKGKWFASSDVKLGGYFIGKYDWNDQKGKDQNGGLDLRFIRLYLDGHCFDDFYYKIQAEMSGAPGDDKGPRALDAFVEWQKWKEMRIKVGQFKRPFTFENPYNPWNVGFGSYSQIVSKLSGMSDRVGEHSSGGRDLGVQLQGDFFPSSDKTFHWLHYQVGLFNGQGINHSDKNKFKDLIGGMWISPVKNLSIGGFGWMGRYANEKYTDGSGMPKNVDRNRWGVGLKYEDSWTIRGEYVASEGRKANSVQSSDKADGWYALLGVPVTSKLKLYGKWDCYRDNKTWESMKSIWGVAANYTLYKNLMLQANYSFTHDRTQRIDKDYNTIDLQVYVRF